MAVKLRLRREGTHKKPHYRIVAADSRSPRNGRFIEIIGHYHPLQEPSGIEVDAERALHWLEVGAQPTEAVENLLRITGVWEQFTGESGPKKKRTEKEKLSKKQREKKREAAEAAAQAAAAPADEPADDAGEAEAEDEA